MYNYRILNNMENASSYLNNPLDHSLKTKSLFNNKMNERMNELY